MTTTRPRDETGELRGRVDHLELMLREADHRIANSLQLASALIGHEADDVADPTARSRLLATQQYVQAIGTVHQLLSVEGGEGLLSLEAYLWRLLAGLQSALANGGVDRRLRLRAEPAQVRAELAIWLGMIMLELVHNACKYAYAEAEPGEVRVSFSLLDEGGFRLEVEDDGHGVAAESRPVGTGLGGRLIRSIASRLGGDFRYVGGGSGARAVLDVPAPRDPSPAGERAPRRPEMTASGAPASGASAPNT